MLKKVLATMLVTLLAFGVVAVKTISASDGQDYSFDTEVSHKAGVFAKLLERVNLAVRLGSEGKAKYWQKLTDVRLAELKMIVDENNLDLIEETSSRYSTYLGRYSEFIINKKVRSQKDTILKQFASHSDILTGLRDKYKYDSAYWLLIQHDINTITIFKNRIEKEL